MRMSQCRARQEQHTAYCQGGHELVFQRHGSNSLKMRDARTRKDRRGNPKYHAVTTPVVTGLSRCAQGFGEQENADGRETDIDEPEEEISIQTAIDDPAEKDGRQHHRQRQQIVACDGGNP